MTDPFWADLVSGYEQPVTQAVIDQQVRWAAVWGDASQALENLIAAWNAAARALDASQTPGQQDVEPGTGTADHK